jgi:hypothetical protein
MRTAARYRLAAPVATSGCPAGPLARLLAEKVSVDAAVGTMVDRSHSSRVLHRVISHDLAHIPPTEAPASL